MIANDLTAEKTNLPSLFSTPAAWFESLCEDITNAKKLIYIEIYRLNQDAIGQKVVRLLGEKAKNGVSVKVLLDSWGTKNDPLFFSPITESGGEIRFFDKIKYNLDFFSKNHQRNHRKIVVIDNHILHFGSANITEYSSCWRESILRVDGSLANAFKKIFLDNWHIASLDFYKKRKYLKTIHVGNMEIVRDLPSIYNQKIKNHFERDIRKAKQTIHIITPYFLPGYKLRRFLILASNRGVQVHIYIPQHSDVHMVDYLRDKYLGYLYHKKIQISFFQPTNLHAKLMLIDDAYFAIGSANFDYRSFRYMHEIMLYGTEPTISALIKDYVIQLQADCRPFDYKKWKNRPTLHKIIGWMLIPFRHLL